MSGSTPGTTTKHAKHEQESHSDSDRAGDPDSRKSTSGVSLFVLGANITAHSRTQQSVALSSGEAELYAIGGGVADSLLVRSRLLNLDFSRRPTFVFLPIQLLENQWRDASELQGKQNMLNLGICMLKNLFSLV
jgi:hypothetical protein